jgi:hypothetical protein
MGSQDTPLKIKDIFPRQRQLLLWIASRSGVEPTKPTRVPQAVNPAQEQEKVIHEISQLAEEGVSVEELDHIWDGRKHVPWSTQEYYDTKATSFLAKLTNQRKRKVTPSERTNKGNDLSALEKSKLIKRLDRRPRKTTNRYTSHVRLTEKGLFYVEIYWDRWINRGMLAEPPPMPNIMEIVDWERRNSSPGYKGPDKEEV